MWKRRRQMDFRYDAFFSYRHKPLDADITQRTFNLVESYRLPKTLRDRGFEEVQRAFRDTEELPVSRVLTATIDQALRSTKCLIVVCSTDTPSSEWIDREVATFIELDRADHIYPLLITGDPDHSFPPSLKLVPDILDRVMDIRTPDNNVRKMMAKAEIEVLRAISDMAGCTEAELLREHKMRKNRRFAARVGAGLAAFAAVAAISLGLMNLAQSYRDTAQKQEEASMRILNELTYSLPDHLTNVPGAYGRIAGILERNTEDINAILRLSTDKAAAEAEAAANYEKLANASAVLGTYDKALSAQETAIASYEELVRQSAEGSGEKLASAYNNLGNLYNASGRYDEAADACSEAINMLCTNLSFSGENVKRVMVTSCHASEGKSYLSMNILRTMAKLGRRVVMVDCDLRRSSIIEHYGIQFQGIENPPGLSHLLAGMAEENDVIYETDIPGAYLVPAGKNVTNSLPLLNSARFQALMQSLGGQFDYVIADAPPIGIVIDAAQIAKYCDGTLLVIGYNTVRRPELLDAKAQIAQTGCPILGTVINMVEYDSFLSRKYGYKSYYSDSHYQKREEKNLKRRRKAR